MKPLRLLGLVAVVLLLAGCEFLEDVFFSPGPHDYTITITNDYADSIFTVEYETETIPRSVAFQNQRANAGQMIWGSYEAMTGEPVLLHVSAMSLGSWTTFPPLEFGYPQDVRLTYDWDFATGRFTLWY